MNTKSLSARIAGIVLVAAVTVAVLIYLLVLAAGGGRLVTTHGHTVSQHHVTGWLIIALVTAGLSLGAWLLARRRLGDLSATEAELDAARAAEQAALSRLAEVKAERDRLDAERRDSAAQRERAEAERDRLKRERQQERTVAERMAKAWHNEREWSRELRVQLSRMQRTEGMLGRQKDVHTMLLELTMGMLDAEKGMLVSGQAGSERPREVVCSSGFENDPRDSLIAQRFAGEVIARDETVREDDSAVVDAAKRTAADAEVNNLVAIPIYLADDFAGVIVCANRDGGFAELDDEVLVAVGDHAGAVLQNSRLHGDLRNSYLTTIRVLANAIELKDPDLRGHSDSVSEYVLAVANRMNLDPQEREELIFASLLHDVGKLGISERILLKPAGLTAEERSVIQLHPRIGFDLVSQVPALRQIAPAVLHHHERYDGAGYPGRLRGETIPLAARIIAVADSFSAIISDRPYSPAQGVEDACVEIERCAGGQFDPEVVALFVEEVRRCPPVESAAEPALGAPELQVHRVEGEFKLGSPSFGITDSVTLLYSHRHFHESAAAEAQRAALQGRSFGVLVVRLGIDGVNCSRGYLAGDAVLHAAGAVVQQAAAGLGGQAFRASGRQLALLAPGADTITLADAAGRLERDLALALSESAVTLGVGVGVWGAGDDGDAVIDRAMMAAQPGSAAPAPGLV